MRKLGYVCFLVSLAATAAGLIGALTLGLSPFANAVIGFLLLVYGASVGAAFLMALFIGATIDKL